jgi:hypothetical protein
MNGKSRRFIFMNQIQLQDDGRGCDLHVSDLSQPDDAE